MQEIDHKANPFPGLRPFESTETHLFFGRDGQSEELLRRLRRTRFLAVVGTSGSGKSSLVRAGLLPALQGGLMASAGSDWRIAILRPGSDPIGSLARALASPAVLGPRDEKDEQIQAVMMETTLRKSSLGVVELVSRARTKLDDKGQPLFPDYENLLVVVDQFEELFRFKQLIAEENSQEDAAAFVKLLLEAVGQEDEKKIYVVLTMRSDFLGDCSQFFELPEAINNGQYLIPRMTRDERREAISGPVAVGQGTISEPLVNQLLNDVGDNPDQLPILQHALMRTWEYWLGHRRNGNPIDIPDYNAIGGMAEALSLHADEAYAELNEKQQAIAEKLFKGLTEKGSDNREIRRPMEVGEICELTGANEAAVIAVVEVFRREGRSFLMPPPNDALTGARVNLNRESLIDISHESLIRNWSRLKTWTEEEAQSARIYRRLAETAMLHHAREEALLIDPALQGALDWREKNQPNAVWAQRYHPEFETALTFLDASVAARNAEMKERERQRKRDVTYKRTKRFTALLLLLCLIALGAVVFATSQMRQAKKAKVVAEGAKVEAFAQKEEATKAKERAVEQAAKAEANGREALAQKKAATEAKVLAEKQAGIAKANELEASKQRAFAETQQKLAQAALNRANVALDDARRQTVIADEARKAAEGRLKGMALASQGLEQAMKTLQKCAQGEDCRLEAQSVLPKVIASDPYSLPIGYSDEIVARILKRPGVPWGSHVPDHNPQGNIVAIILHTSSSPDNIVEVLRNGRPGLQGPLAHWLVKSDGKIEFIVPETVRAMHVGRTINGLTNSNTIGVEASGIPAFANELQIENLVRLVADIADRWGVPTNMILSHAEVANPPGRKNDMLQQAPAVRQMVEAVRSRK
ncbi:MAG TPA: N-acetylmuramoyl-L-alanine amidase [Pyrinomonadaceae bacterium]|nr:N-acetylmuramoyl-L-alanine amidase [Pyrinomonadaceae bacterium]